MRIYIHTNEPVVCDSMEMERKKNGKSGRRRSSSSHNSICNIITSLLKRHMEMQRMQNYANFSLAYPFIYTRMFHSFSHFPLFPCCGLLSLFHVFAIGNNQRCGEEDTKYGTYVRRYMSKRRRRTFAPLLL